MENIVIMPENQEQFSAIKTFLQAMKIRFRIEKEDDTLMAEEEFYIKIDRAIKQAEEGKGIIINTEKELHDYLNSL